MVFNETCETKQYISVSCTVIPACIGSVQLSLHVLVLYSYPCMYWYCTVVPACIGIVQLVIPACIGIVPSTLMLCDDEELLSIQSIEQKCIF